MRSITKTLLACAIALMATPALADEAISLKVGYMTLQPSGQFGATAAGLVGTNVDVRNDLGLDRSNNVHAEAAIQLGDSRLSVGYMPIKSTGTGTLTQAVNFNGTTYTAATSVNSTLKADIIDIAYTYYLINMDDMPSRLQLGIEASLKYTKAEVSMKTTVGGVTQTRSATAPIPTIGLRGRVALADFIGLSGRIGYLGYAGNRFLDADAQLEFSPLPMVGIYGGYRHLDLKVDNSGVLVDTRIAGPYVGALVRF